MDVNDQHDQCIFFLQYILKITIIDDELYKKMFENLYQI